MNLVLSRVMIAFSILLTISSLNVVAQKEPKPGLVLTGALERPPKLTSPLEDRKKSVYEINVYMQMRNDTDEPIIVFRPEDFKGVKKIDFSSALRLKDRSVIASAFTFPWKNHLIGYEGEYQVMARFVERISSDQPPSYTFEIIRPGGYFEFRDTFKIEFVDPAFDPEYRDSDYWTKYVASKPIADFPSFTIEYNLSAKTLVSGDNDFLKNLQRRWRSIGNLVLNSSGDYSVRSDSIVGISVN